jgi:trans-aconitate methyltransferase
LQQYNPPQYWQESGKTYYDKFQYNSEYQEQEKQLIDYLSHLKFNSVLELGAGFGRITNLIDREFKPSKYVVVDISEDQLNHITIPNIIKITSDISKFDTDQKFDLVIAVEVLMHQLPDKVQSIVDNMKRWSKKHVISLDYDGPSEGLAEHNFSHDYHRLYGELKGMIPLDKQSLYHWSR